MLFFPWLGPQVRKQAHGEGMARLWSRLALRRTSLPTHLLPDSSWVVGVANLGARYPEAVVSSGLKKG